MIARAKVRIFDPFFSNVYTQDASNETLSVDYSFDANGCAAATINTNLLWEQVYARGYYQGRNGVEISTADDSLQVACAAGATKLYVTATAPYDATKTLTAAQIDIDDGANPTYRIPVTGVGTDSGGAYITIGAPIAGTGNNTSLPAYGVGATIFRRVYAGRIARKTRVNDRSQKMSYSCVGIVKRLAEVQINATFNSIDIGQAAGAVVTNAVSRLTDLVFTNAAPTIGTLYSGQVTNTDIFSFITSNLLATVSSGDIWVLRVGHDRAPLITRLYTSATNTYTFNVMLPQRAVKFRPLEVETDDEDISNMANSVLVVGDTDPITKQPIQNVYQDSTSIPIYGQIDGDSVSNVGVKDTTTAANFGRGVLNSRSFPQASSSFKLFVRNDNTALAAPASPTGLANGDVVYGYENIMISGFDSADISPNKCPDSGLSLISGTTSLWTQRQLTAGLGTTNYFATQAGGTNGGAFAYLPNVTTLDGPINYGNNVTTSAPFPSGVNLSYTYTRWVGYLLAPTTGTYTIGVNSDDGANLYVNGVQLVSNLPLSQNSSGGTSGSVYSQSGSIALTAGTYYPIVVEYENQSGGYEIQLLWTVPGGSVVLVPSSTLSTSSTSVTGKLAGSWWNGTSTSWYPSAVNGIAYSQPWLTGPNQTYTISGYIDATYGAGGPYATTPNATTLDGPINYGNAVSGSAAFPSGVNSSYTYTRWVGYLLAPTTGTYTIGVNSDDGANLYVNGVELVTNLTTQQGSYSSATYTQSGTIALTAGTYYSIVLEYQNAAGQSEIQLLWTPPGGSVVLVPSSALSTSSTSVTGKLAGSWWNGTSTSWYPSTSSGAPRWSVYSYNSQTGQVGTLLAASYGILGRAITTPGVTFTIPANVYEIVVAAEANGATLAGFIFNSPNLNATSSALAYVANSAAPNIYGLASSVSNHIDGGMDRVQTISFQPVEPDINASIAERVNAVVAQINAAKGTPFAIDQYCVSADIQPPSYTYSATSLVVAFPTYLALFAKGTSIITIPAANVTLPASSNAVYVFVTSSGTYVTQANNSAAVAGAILIGYFTTNATGVIGSTFRAAVGVIKIGVGNINVASGLPVPNGTSVSIANGNSLNGIAADVIVGGTFTNVPNSAIGLLWVYRLSTSAGGNGTWIPYGTSNLAVASGTSYPTNPQYVTFEFDLTSGTTYDFGVAYESLAGYGPIAAPPTWQGFVARAIGIPTTYMIGGVPITPTQVNGAATTTLSANGANASAFVQFQATNQPTNGSLSRINFWIRPSALGGSNTIGASNFNWAPYGGLPASGVNSTSPSSNAVYSFSPADLMNSTAYDFGFSYEDAQGYESIICVVVSSFTAAVLNLPASANSPIPTAIASAGPNITSSALGTQVNQGAGVAGQPFTFSIGDWTAGNNPGWFAGFLFYWRVHNDTTTAPHQLGEIGVITTVSNIPYMIPLGAGGTYDIGIAYEGANSTISTIVWPTGLQNATIAPINPAQSVAGTGNINLIPDGQLAHVVSALNEAYWSEYGIDGVLFGVNLTPDVNAPYTCFFWKNGAGANRYANSPAFQLNAGVTYTLSMYSDLLNATGTMTLNLIAVSGTVSNVNPTNSASATASVSQTGNKVGTVSAQFTPTVTGMYCVQISNAGVSIGSTRIYAGAFQVMQGASFTGFVPSTPVTQSGLTSIAAAPVSTQLASIGTQVNHVADSDIKFTPGPNAYWQAPPTNFAYATYFEGRQAFSYVTPSGGASAVNYYLQNSAGYINVLAGQTYTLSALCDTSQFATGAGNMALIMAAVGGSEQTRLTVLPGINHTAGVRQSVNVTIGSGVTQIQLVWQQNWASSAAGGAAFIGQIQFEVGSVATAYKANDSQHGGGSLAHGAMSTGVQTALATTGQIINTQIKSSFLNFQASTLNWQGTPVVSYTSTTSSITISVPASTYLRTDGTTVSVPVLTQSFTGLSANTYHYDVYYIAASNLFGIAAYGTNTPSNAQIFADCYTDGRVNIYANYPATVPSSGSGGGSAGGGGSGSGNSCPAEYQIVLTKERGVLRADEVDVGMHLPKNGGWVRVNEAMRAPTTLWRFTVRKNARIESFDVNETHAVRDHTGEWLAVCEMRVGDRLRARSDGELEVVDVQEIGPGHFIGFDVDGHEFEMGETCAHNAVTL